MRTCLQIIQNFCGARGLSQPNTVASSDLQTIQMLALLNEDGAKLQARYEWQALTAEATFTTLAAASQGTLESIIGASANFRKIIDETIWNRTTRAIVFGPISPQERQGRAAITTAGPYSEYYIRGGTLYFDPIPSAGDSCYFEYLSRNWATAADGVTRKSRMTLDDDLPLFDDVVLEAGLQWRWNKAKGLDYAQDFQDYERLVADAMIGDKTARRIRLDNHTRGLRTGVFVPSGSWQLS